MRTWIVIALALAACGNKSSEGDKAAPAAEPAKAEPAKAEPAKPAAIDPAAEAISKANGYADAACACKDKACADKVLAEMNAWGAEMKKADRDPSLNEQQTKEMDETGQRFGACIVKLSAPQ